MLFYLFINIKSDEISQLRLWFVYLFIYFKINLFIFGCVLGLRCCARAFSSCGEWRLLFVAMHGLLIAVASLVAEHRL